VCFIQVHSIAKVVAKTSCKRPGDVRRDATELAARHSANDVRKFSIAAHLACIHVSIAQIVRTAKSRTELWFFANIHPSERIRCCCRCRCGGAPAFTIGLEEASKTRRVHDCHLARLFAVCFIQVHSIAKVVAKTSCKRPGDVRRDATELAARHSANDVRKFSIAAHLASIHVSIAQIVRAAKSRTEPWLFANIHPGERIVIGCRCRGLTRQDTGKGKLPHGEYDALQECSTRHGSSQP